MASGGRESKLWRKSGDSVAFFSRACSGVADRSGAPGTLPYVARRGALAGRRCVGGACKVHAQRAGRGCVSSTLESTLALGKLGPNEGGIPLGTVAEFLLHRTDSPDTEANWEVAGEPIEASIKTSVQRCVPRWELRLLSPLLP